MRTKKTMSEEIFNSLIQQDYWINAIANPVKCCDKYGHFEHYRTCSYLTEYVVSNEQVFRAREVYARRKFETLASIQKGELIFRAMGGDFEPKYEDGIGNYRIRCYFKNTQGHHYFIELSASHSPEKRFFVSFSIDEDLHQQREEERKKAYELRKRLHGTWAIADRQDYYNCFGVEKKYQEMAFTFANVMKFVNQVYGCKYTSSRLIHYFANCEEWCCEC